MEAKASGVINEMPLARSTRETREAISSSLSPSLEQSTWMFYFFELVALLEDSNAATTSF